jgi:hypothetical protein
LAVLFLCHNADAKVIVVSTSTPVNVLPTTFFGVKTVTLFAATTQQVYLNTEAIASTQSFVNASYSITQSTGILIIPNFHGQIWALAPNSPAAVNLFSLNGD